MSLTIAQRIKKRCRGRAICEVFENAPWSGRDDALAPLGIIHPEACVVAEISRNQAVSVLTEALAVNLCYGVRRLGPNAGLELAEVFVQLFSSSPRFFTNSKTPYQAGESAWCFSGATEATVDTGVVVREGKNLSGILWLSDVD